MSHDLLIELELALCVFTKAHQSKGEQAGEKLKDVLNCLLNLQYSKSDLAFVFDVEPLTVERWLKGNEKRTGTFTMRAETFAKFVERCQAILAGKSLHPIKASDSGFITWRYQVEHEQTTARRTWYIASSGLIPVNSLAFKESIKNLFSKERQNAENRKPPVKVYIYPPDSEAADSLVKWEASLLQINEKENLCGSIIGIADSSLPWFLPGVRALILEKETDRGEIYVKGYLRVPLQEDAQTKLLKALDPLERNADTPWLSVQRPTAEEWYVGCMEKYGAQVDLKCKEQDGFKVHYISQDNKK